MTSDRLETWTGAWRTLIQPLLTNAWISYTPEVAYRDDSTVGTVTGGYAIGPGDVITGWFRLDGVIYTGILPTNYVSLPFPIRHYVEGTASNVWPIIHVGQCRYNDAGSTKVLSLAPTDTYVEPGSWVLFRNWVSNIYFQPCVSGANTQAWFRYQALIE